MDGVPGRRSSDGRMCRIPFGFWLGLLVCALALVAGSPPSRSQRGAVCMMDQRLNTRIRALAENLNLLVPREDVYT